MEWWLALLIFLTNVVENAASAIYTMKVIERKPLVAALIGSHIDLIATISVILYVEDWRYTIFLFAGSFCGTYSSTHINKWYRRRTRLKNLKKARLAKLSKSRQNVTNANNLTQ